MKTKELNKAVEEVRKNGILNLTQHRASAEQIMDGVIEPDDDTKNEIVDLLTFNELPNLNEISDRSRRLCKIANNLGFTKIMIGGAPYLMSVLEHDLLYSGLKPLYSFTKRVSIEKTNENGEVVKTSVFRHEGFIGLR